MKKTLTLLAVFAFVITPFVTHAAARSSSTSTVIEDRALKVGDRVANAKDRAKREIDRRIESLNKLIERIRNMKRLTESDQDSLETTLTGQITALTALGVQIESSTATSSLRTDIESITKSYRIYALVLPQITIIAAADRVLNTAAHMDLLTAKLETRIGSVGSATDVQLLTTTLTAMKTKIVDAKEKAEAAIAAVKVLTPDGGEHGLAQANLDALKAAQEKVRAAQKALVAAHADARVIIKGLKEAVKPPQTATKSEGEN